jgi:hypothetical protein
MKITKTEVGQIIKIKHQEKTDEFVVPRFGRHHAFALAASLAVEEIIKKSKSYLTYPAYRQAGKLK